MLGYRKIMYKPKINGTLHQSSWIHPEMTKGCTLHLSASNHEWESTPKYNPITIFFFGLEGEYYPHYPHLLTILPCPFCLNLLGTISLFLPNMLITFGV
jgi:hypothetical protein